VQYGVNQSSRDRGRRPRKPEERCASGVRAMASKMPRWDRQIRAQPACRQNRKPRALRFENTRSCRWLTVYTPCRTRVPHLTRSSLHRLYQRHGISRLPDMKAEAEPKKAFKSYPIGYFHIDIAEVRTDDGKPHMFDMRCRENGIEHRLTQVRHPWTNGQVERMNRTLK